MSRLFILVIVFLSIGLSAQEPMRVTRSGALDRNATIYNIYVDSDNKKWVGNSAGTFQVHTVDFAEKVALKDDQTSLLKYSGGNFNLIWNTASVFKLLSDETDGLFEGEQDISGAFYDPNTKELWIGTKGIGVFRIDMTNEARLEEHITMDNSKLRTDMITVMFSDKPGSYWIGTEEGVLHNYGSKWKLFERYTNIKAIDKSGSDVWVFGEGWLWKVENGKIWEEIDLDETMSEGAIKDIAFDSQGRMWIASEVITRFNPELGSVEKFGAAEYFTSDFPSAVAVDQDDAIWVGTEDKGLYLIEKATAMTVSCILDKAPGCDGKTNAELKVVVSGGTEPYSYNWNGGLDGQMPKNVSPGDYEVTVTDDRGKTRTAVISINDPAITVKAVQVQAESGPDNMDGIASIAVSGGQGGYTYKWDNGETDEKATKLSIGEHTVTVTDEAGCSNVASVTISQQALPLNVNILQVKEITCKGASTAALEVEIKGGKGPFVYTWSNPSLTGEYPENIAAGDYNLTITDAESSSSTVTISIPEPEGVSASIQIESPASTGNADGKATVKAKGGSGAYRYKWDNGENGETASKLAPGLRTVTVTDDAGCTTTTEIEISENILPLSAQIEQTAEVACYGTNEAALNVSIQGGKGPFQYAWNSDALIGANLSNLKAGEYILTVTDAEGNTTLADIIISEPEMINASVVVEASASTGNADGKATAKAKGGSGVYQYKWDNGENGETASKLAPGLRTVTVTDDAGCTATAEIEISENILPLNASIEQTSDINCYGVSTASAEVKVNGGKGPFQYDWGETTLLGANPENIGAGKYEVIVTDSEGTTTTANITIIEPEILNASITVEAPASTENSDGVASVKVKGGTEPYSFKWDNDETESKASKLAPGTRFAIVTDARGCSVTVSTEISENILPLNASIEQMQEIKCNGASEAVVQVDVNGGKGPFLFNWSGAGLSGEQPREVVAGEYEVTITDAEGTTTTANITIKEPEVLNASITVEAPASTGNADGVAVVKVTGGTEPYSFKWDNNETANTASKLAPGTRSVTITDASGCSTSAIAEISENILPLNASIEQTQEIKCNGAGEATVQVKINGGKGPYQYAWNNPSLAGASPKSITSGDYEVTITDAEGTTSTANITLTEPEAISASVKVNASASTGNSDGKATAKATGGSGSYTFSWSNGEQEATATKLGPGEHTVTVTDENGCATTATTSVDENILPLSVAIEQIAEVNCSGESSAALTVEVSGGKGPFQFDWSEGSLNGENPKNIAAGEYELKVTDVEGTVAMSKVFIEEPKVLVTELSENKLTSNENSKDGAAKVSVTGGTPPYTIKWDNGEEGEKAKELGIGNHTVSVSDSKGCNTVLEFETKKKILPQLTLSRLRKGQTVKMEQLFFEADSFRITTVSLPVLDELYGFMIENPSVVIEVGGHTNDVPEDAFCNYLSEARAKSVADFIVQKGIDPKRVFYKGYGKRKPLVSNRTAEGRRKNQRVEIKILSI